MLEDGSVISLHKQRLRQLPQIRKAVIEGANSAPQITNKHAVGRRLQRRSQLCQQHVELAFMLQLLASIQHREHQPTRCFINAAHAHFYSDQRAIGTANFGEKFRTTRPVRRILPERFLHQRSTQHIDILILCLLRRIASERNAGRVGMHNLECLCIQQPDSLLQTIQNGCKQRSEMHALRRNHEESFSAALTAELSKK